MNRYADANAKLSELEWFDPRAFVGDEKCPQAVCDLVLALALIYNDFRDVVFAQALLGDVMPADQTNPSREIGNHAGFQVHLSRLVAGILHELVALIQRTADIRAHPSFASVVKNLPTAARSAWNSVVAAADNKPSKDPLAMLLVRARNKVAFHYDHEEIGSAYRSAFVEKSDRVPYVSRGASMAAARFYFADAAAQMYMMEVTSGATAQQFLDADSPLFKQVNHALRELVTLFINVRAGYRK